MSDVEKEGQLVACCLNNLYGCYASLQTFLNFLIMKSGKKKNNNNSQDHLILKFSEKRVKEIPRNFGFD